MSSQSRLHVSGLCAVFCFGSSVGSFVISPKRTNFFSLFRTLSFCEQAHKRKMKDLLRRHNEFQRVLFEGGYSQAPRVAASSTTAFVSRAEELLDNAPVSTSAPFRTDDRRLDLPEPRMGLRTPVCLNESTENVQNVNSSGFQRWRNATIQTVGQLVWLLLLVHFSAREEFCVI